MFEPYTIPFTSNKICYHFQVRDDYIDGYDYGELFTTFVLNISSEDLENITFGLAYTNENVTDKNTTVTTPSQTDSDWTVALNIAAGIGILVNSILLFIVVIDLVLDKQCRKKSRHWLIFHSSIIHILYLVNAISLNGVSLEFHKDHSNYRIWIHLANSFEFMVNLSFILYGMNVIFKCYRSMESKGYKHLFLWFILILFTWLIGHVYVNEMITSKYFSQLNITKKSIITPLRILGEDDHAMFAVLFAVPYAISIILLLTSIMFRAAKLKYHAKSSSERNYSGNGIEADAILFLSVLILVGLFTLAPYFIFRLNDVYRIPTNNIHLYYTMVLLDIMFYVTFPIVSLSLYDIRLIFHKLISTSTMNECFELE